MFNKQAFVLDAESEVQDLPGAFRRAVREDGMATLEEQLLAVQTQLQQLPADDQAARQRLAEEKDVLMLLLKQKVLAQEERVLLLKERAAVQPQAAPAGDIMGEVKKIRKFLEREVAFLHYRGTGSSRPKTSVYRVPCMTRYNGAGFAEREHLRCLLTGMEFPASKVLAAHIFRHEWEDRRPLIAAGLSIDGPENVIPCYETVERALDHMRITIEPTSPDVFTVRVLDRSLLQAGQWIVKTDTSSMQWSDLDEKVIDFMDLGDTSPLLSALVCAIHMRAALRKAEMNGWLGVDEWKVPKWAQQLVNNPAAGLTESFLRSAAQSSEASSADTPSSQELDSSS